MFIICVCNDPATTEIYTDLHTLSLPDARPSFGRRHRLGLVVGDIDGGVAELVVQPADLEPHLLAEIGVQVRERLVEEKDLRLDDQGAGERSEEHTSELQSLMRNSYAVFCLKKKQNRSRNNDHNKHIS